MVEIALPDVATSIIVSEVINNIDITMCDSNSELSLNSRICIASLSQPSMFRIQVYEYSHQDICICTGSNYFKSIGNQSIMSKNTRKIEF